VTIAKEEVPLHQPATFSTVRRRAYETATLAKLKAMLRRPLDPFVPSHFQDLPGLAGRLLRDRHPAAMYAMGLAAVGTLLTPLDLLLQMSERQLYRRAPEPKLPLIFVCGPPRSGTTLVTQVLINNLPVSYLNNLTAVFPRSPVKASLLFEPIIRKKEIEYKSFYGRTVRLSGPNDGLQQWDRWFGNDRKRVPTGLSDQQRDEMLAFFGAYENAFGKPLIAKNNILNTCAHLVAGALSTSHFICLTRDPVYLAQSLLRARLDLYGDAAIWYGVEDSAKSPRGRDDFIQDVCKQVLFHESKINEQLKLIGPERFWVVGYEEFCKQPKTLVRRLSEDVLKQPLHGDRLLALDRPFKVSSRIRIERSLFDQIESTLSCISTSAATQRGHPD